jgi:heat shock protein HtpX
VTEWAQIYQVDTTIPSVYDSDLIRFIFRFYILPLRQHFVNIRDIQEQGNRGLEFTYLDPKSGGHVQIQVIIKKPIDVKVAPSPEIPIELLDEIRDDIIITVGHFEEQMRRTTLYFAWVEGQEVIPEKTRRRSGRTLDRLFSDSMILLMITFMVVNFLVISFLYSYIGPYAILVILAFQLVIVLFSDRIIYRQGNWAITSENPKIHLISYPLSQNEYINIRQRYQNDDFHQMKKEIYDNTLANGLNIDCSSAAAIFNKHGIRCNPEKMTSRVVNIYDIISKTAKKFDLPIPKVTVMNVMQPNAAASGPGPSRGVVLITTGLVAQLDDEEIESVIGHELSHLKNHDPLIMFGLTAIEYLVRVYIFSQFIFGSLFFLFPYFYLMISMGVVYFIAKFLEARCDLEAAVKIGKPKRLAEALRKMGYMRLQYERMPSVRIQEWIGFDPHPPIYFRVNRLDNLEVPIKAQNLLLTSIRDCINGLIAAIRG